MITGTVAKGIGDVYGFKKKLPTCKVEYGVNSCKLSELKLRDKQFPTEMCIFFYQDVSRLKIGRYESVQISYYIFLKIAFK